MNLIIFIIYSCFVTYCSLSQMSSITIPDIVNVDKVYHIILYGMFTLLAFRTFKSKTIFYIVCIGILAYSGLMEIGQSFVPNRSMSFYDLIANSIGVVLVCIIATKYFNSYEEKKNN